MIICRCNEVTLSEIKIFLKKHPGATLSDLIISTGASTKCGRCKPILIHYFNKIKKDQPVNDQLSFPF